MKTESIRLKNGGERIVFADQMICGDTIKYPEVWAKTPYGMGFLEVSLELPRNFVFDKILVNKEKATIEWSFFDKKNMSKTGGIGFDKEELELLNMDLVNVIKKDDKNYLIQIAYK